MQHEVDLLNVSHHEDRLVVRFNNPNLVDFDVFTEFRQRLTQLIESSQPEVVVFDLTGVSLFPSGVYGCLAALTQLDVEVQLYNPSDRTREVLEITKLDQLIKVRDEAP